MLGSTDSPAEKVEGYLVTRDRYPSDCVGRNISIADKSYDTSAAVNDGSAAATLELLVPRMRNRYLEDVVLGFSVHIAETGVDVHLCHERIVPMHEWLHMASESIDSVEAGKGYEIGGKNVARPFVTDSAVRRSVLVYREKVGRDLRVAEIDIANR